MIEQIVSEIQNRLDELLDEIDKLRRALLALGSREQPVPPSTRTAPTRADGRTRSAPAKPRDKTTRAPAPPASVPAATSPKQVPESPPVSQARNAPRAAPGAILRAIFEALADGNSMTAAELASTTAIPRTSLDRTLAGLVKAGELTKAADSYQLAVVDPAQRFHLWAQGHGETGAFVASLQELEDELAVSDPSVLRHHCPSHDFSRWVAGVFGNAPLAAAIGAAEAQLHHDSPHEAVEQVRQALIAALEARHTSER